MPWHREEHVRERDSEREREREFYTIFLADVHISKNAKLPYKYVVCSF